jgi:alpha-2-macroglobulin
VHWSPPRWLQFGARQINRSLAALNRARRRSPLRFWASCAGVVILIAAGAAAIDWYRHRPPPRYVEYTVTWPGPTELKPGSKPNPVTVSFSGSAAALGSIGKQVPSGITVTPPVDGVWQWNSDTYLQFTPKRDWEVGRDYDVTLDRKLFGPGVLLKSYSFRFRSPAFAASLGAAEFYQDPTDPRINQVVATFTFTHPVDKSDFEKRLALQMSVEPAKGKQPGPPIPFGFKVSYDQTAGKAFVHSESFRIPDNNAQMLLTLAKGVHSSRGGPGTVAALQESVPIPGVATFFQIQSVNATVAAGPHDTMERVCSVSASVPMHQGDLATNISVVLLPKDRPAIGNVPIMQDYQWSDPTEAVPAVMALATPVPIQWLPSEREYMPVQSFKFSADTGRFLLVTINRGLKSYGGYPLSAKFSAVIAAAQFPQSIKIVSQGSLLSLSGDRKISILTRSVSAVRIKVSRLLPGTVSHLVAQTRGTFSNPEFVHDYGRRAFGLEDLSEIFSEVRPIAFDPSGRNQYMVFDFGPMLSSGALPHGLFSIDVENWDPVNKQVIDGGPSDQRLVLLTDLGFLVKDAVGGTHDVFVQSIRAGAPVAGAEVDILGKNGLPILTQTTDTNGRASFPTLTAYKHEKTPTVYVVSKDNDFSFLPYNRYDRQLNLSRFDTGGLYTQQANESLQAYLFSDRGIYRPGDSIHVGIVVKRQDWTPLPAGVPLELDVTDPRGLEIRRQMIKFPPAGFEQYSTATQEDSPTGHYDFSLYLARDQNSKVLLGSTTVRVEDFQPDRMKIKAQLSAAPSAGWISPNGLNANVLLRTLFGTAAVGRTVKGSLQLSPAGVSFAKYADYYFVDPYSTSKSYTEDLGDQTTNANGEVKFDLQLGRFEKGVYRLRFIAEGFEPEGGRSVVADATAIVSPAPYLVAYKADGDLGYINKDAARSVKLIAVGPNLQTVAAPTLTTELIEYRYVSVLTKQDDGTMAFQSVRKDISRGKHDLALPAQGLTFKLPSANPGSFALVIRASDGEELNRIYFEIAGNANVTRSLEHEAELTLKLDKPEYAPGEQASISIRAPYVGAGLITVERDRVYNAKWFQTTTTESVQSIAIPPELEGNGYITVTFVRSIDSPEVFTSPLSYGSVPFTVSRARHTLDVKLDVAAMVRPGDTLKVGYQTAGPARIVLFAVDEGILQVARYKTPDPLSYFFRKRALEVTTAQILDLILPELHLLNQASAPGGDNEALRARNQNPFKRKGQKPLAVWSGLIDTDGKPGVFEVPVPNYFNGTIRVMAVAVAGSSIGAAARKAISQGDFVIQPQAPYFAAPGDEFDVTAMVANNIKGAPPNASAVKVELDTSKALEAVGAAVQSVTIEPGHDLTVSFRVRAKAALGDATMVVKASAAGKSATYSLDMSVRPASPYVTTIASGYVKKGLLQGVTADVSPRRKMYPEFRTIEVSGSALPLGLANGLVYYLTRFPYGCTEQVVSEAFPGVVLGTRPELGLTADQVNKSLARAIATLQGRQNADGAFGLWSAGPDVSNLVTAYATHFLIEMRDHGLSVPPGLLEQALKALRTIVATPASSMPELRAQTYALYLLARSGVVVTDPLGPIRDALDQNFPKIWKNDAAALYLAATYQLLKMDKEATALIRNAPATNSVTPDYDDYYDDLVYRATYLYLVSKHFPDRVKSITGDQILQLADPITHDRANTISSAYAIIALDAYQTAAGTPGQAKIAFSQTMADGSVQPLTAQGTIFAQAAVSPGVRSVHIEADTPFALFYQLIEAGFDLEQPTSEIKNGIEVFREFRDEKGHTITSSPLESKVDVYVSVRALDSEKTNVAVVDLLPGGFEVDISPHGLGDRTSIVNGPDTWHPDYIDVREDRVIFYGAISTGARTFVYRLKPTNRGKFAVPPLYAEGMYDRSVQARSMGAQFVIDNPQAASK